MNKDTKIEVTYQGFGNFYAEDWPDIDDRASLFVVLDNYVKEKEEMRRILRECLISMTCIDSFQSRAFKDGLRVLDLTLEDLN